MNRKVKTIDRDGLMRTCDWREAGRHGAWRGDRRPEVDGRQKGRGRGQSRGRRTIHHGKTRRLEWEDVRKVDVLHHHRVTAVVKGAHVPAHAEPLL